MDKGLSLKEILDTCGITNKVDVFYGRNGSEYHKETRYFPNESLAKKYISSLIEQHTPKPYNDCYQFGLYLYDNKDKNTYMLYQLKTV